LQIDEKRLTAKALRRQGKKIHQEFKFYKQMRYSISSSSPRIFLPWRLGVLAVNPHLYSIGRAAGNGILSP
jgi:hypothetical protein